MRIGNSDTRVVLFTMDQRAVGSHFQGALACDNIDRTYDELTGRGVEFVSPPTKQPWGAFAIFKDPDGNQFVLSTR